MTSSGKIQRSACRDMFLTGIDAPIACWTQDPIHGQPADDQNATPTTSDAPPTADVAHIEKWLITKMSEAIGVPGDQIDPSETFARHGLDSIGAVEIAMDLMNQFDVELGPSTFWDYPSPNALACHVSQLQQGTGAPPWIR